MTTTASFWDRQAQGYATQPIADMHSYTSTLQRTQALLKATDRVLEVGCGTGATARLLAASVQSIEGTDISPEMIAIARQKASEEGITNAEFNVATVSDTRFGETGYDAVLAHNILHLLDDLDTGIADLATAVKPGGWFISKTPCLGKDGFSLKTRAMKTMVGIMRLFGKAPPVLFFSPTALEVAVKDAGFEVLESADFPVGKGHRYIVARKRV